MTCCQHESLGQAPRSVVTVNGAVIAHHLIAQEVQHHPARSPAEAWLAAARALVVRELLLQRAAALGLRPEPEADADGRRETDEEALARAVIARDVQPPEIGEASCLDYYERHRARFRSADILEASHVLMAADHRDAKASAGARARAGELLALISAGSASLGEVAQAYSDCPSRLNGGSLGQITKGDTAPEFEEALLGLEPGELAPVPIASRHGFHILRLDRRIEGAELPFDVVRPRIAAYLEATARRRAEIAYVGALLAEADIGGIALGGAGGGRAQQR